VMVTGKQETVFDRRLRQDRYRSRKEFRYHVAPLIPGTQRRVVALLTCRGYFSHALQETPGRKHGCTSGQAMACPSTGAADTPVGIGSVRLASPPVRLVGYWIGVRLVYDGGGGALSHGGRRIERLSQCCSHHPHCRCPRLLVQVLGSTPARGKAVRAPRPSRA